MLSLAPQEKAQGTHLFGDSGEIEIRDAYEEEVRTFCGGSLGRFCFCVVHFAVIHDLVSAFLSLVELVHSCRHLHFVQTAECSRDTYPAVHPPHTQLRHDAAQNSATYFPVTSTIQLTGV